jgi:hypothetical protein
VCGDDERLKDGQINGMGKEDGSMEDGSKGNKAV